MRYKCLSVIRDINGRRIKRGEIVNESRLNEIYIDTYIRLKKILPIEEITLKPYEGELKPCIVTGMWKRPEVFKIFGKHYENIGIDVIVVGSEGNTSKKLAESFGFIYLERPNKPLGAKMNTTIKEALKRGYTHVICVGSDDLLSRELIDEYISLINDGYDFIGLTDFYFYELKTGKASYWGGYIDGDRIGNTVGAGRVFSRRLIESWGGIVWDSNANRYLDGTVQRKIITSKYPQVTFSLKKKGMFAVDIKSDVNVTPFKLWDNSWYIEPCILTDKFDLNGTI